MTATLLVSAAGVFRLGTYSASFSNYGRCVEVYAPGVAVTSAWLYSGTNTIQGISMFSPHVADVGVQYKSLYGDVASSTINSWITGNATSGVIRSNPLGRSSLLLATPDVQAPPPPDPYEPPPCRTCDIL